MKRENRVTVYWLLLQMMVLTLAIGTITMEWTPPSGVQRLTTSIDGTTWRATTLPHDWRSSNFTSERADYEFAFSLEQIPNRPWAVLITSLRMQSQISINDYKLTPGVMDKEQSKLARMWFRPLFLSIPSSALRAGENRLHIALSASSGEGYLAVPLIGTHEVLAAFTQRLFFTSQLLLQGIFAAMTAVGMLMLVLWSKRRNDSVYGLYGIGMLCWAIHNLNFILVNPPIATRHWEAFSDLALGGFIVATTFFIHRYMKESRPRIERGVLLLAICGAVPLFVLPEEVFASYSNYFWHPAILSIGLYLYIHILLAAWHQRSASLHFLAMTGSVMVAYGIHDMMIIMGFFPWGTGYMLPYSAAPSLVVFSSLLVGRFARSLDEMETLLKNLDNRVKVAANEIESNHARMSALERECWLSSERNRLARDIHDGVGGQLVSLLVRVKSGKNVSDLLEAELSQALNDLRLVIDALDAPVGDLGAALATWRHRLQRRLDPHSLRLVWQPCEMMPLHHLGPSDILNIIRLLDEAVTNVIRHADATELTVLFQPIGDFVVVSVMDNGHGGAHEQSSGHGISNMRNRAQELDAILTVVSNQKGTKISLQLPTRSHSVPQ